MAQRVVALAVNHVDLSSIPGAYLVEGENNSHRFSSDFHTHAMAHMDYSILPTHMHTPIN